jgi:16S rRNA (uracil1498-N3)-methyltransferase
MNLFYLPNLQYDDATAPFTEEESVHGVRVLRLKVGDEVLITNGKGWMFTAVISEAHPKHTQAQIISKQHLPRVAGFHLHVAVAPTKNIARYEWFLEKACEIGVDEITPLVCEHSERQKLNMERLNRVLVAAIKQSQTAVLPLLHPPCDLQKFALQCDTQQKFVGWCGEHTAGELFDLAMRGNSVTVLIGPEGDFSEKEINLLKDNGFQPVSMGRQRLRTETAGMVACCILNTKNNINI